MVLPLIPGFVPEFECREAAIYTCMTWAEWEALSVSDQADAVAHYRMNLMIKAHLDDAVGTQADRDRRRAARRTPRTGS